MVDGHASWRIVLFDQRQLGNGQLVDAKLGFVVVIDGEKEIYKGNAIAVALFRLWSTMYRRRDRCSDLPRLALSLDGVCPRSAEHRWARRRDFD